MPRTLGDSLHPRPRHRRPGARATTPILEVPPPEADRDHAADRRVRRRAGRGRLDDRVRHRPHPAGACWSSSRTRRTSASTPRCSPTRIIDLIESRRHHRRAQDARPRQDRRQLLPWARGGSTTTSTTTRSSPSTRPSTSTTRSSSASSTRWWPSTSRWRSTSPARSAPTRSATQFFSGIGGQVDFNRGAARRRGGKAIIALPSTAQDGTISRIVTRLSPGAGVVTTRGDVHYVVTEYGVAYLHGKSVQERALALISIAHPEFRAAAAPRGHRGQVPVAPELADVEGKILVGPQELRTTYLLDDGTQINFRPIHPTDEPRMRDLFYALSAGDDLLPLHEPPEAGLAQADPGLRLHRPPQRRGHRRHRCPRPTARRSSPSAATTSTRRPTGPKWPSSCATSGRTAASARFLLKHLIAHRRAATASAASPPRCSRDNKPMQAVFNKSNCKIKSKFTGNVYSYEMDFE